MLEKVKQFVDESFRAGVNFSTTQKAHFEGTLKWIQILNPGASEAMLIAAYAHDISRAFRKTDSAETFKNREFNDPEYLKEHQEKSAMIISDFLRKNDYPEADIEIISEMVKRHEEGGDDNSNLLMDADSLSFLENNTSHFINQIAKQGKEKIKNKISWMYIRISSDQAKELAKPYYDKALEMLKNN